MKQTAPRLGGEDKYFFNEERTVHGADRDLRAGGVHLARPGSSTTAVEWVLHTTASDLSERPSALPAEVLFM